MRELTFLAFSFSTLFVCLFFSAEPASCKSQERAAVRCAATARPRCMAPRLQPPCRRPESGFSWRELSKMQVASSVPMGTLAGLPSALRLRS